jgi:hypothetical protein
MALDTIIPTLVKLFSFYKNTNKNIMAILYNMMYLDDNNKENIKKNRVK